MRPTDVESKRKSSVRVGMVDSNEKEPVIPRMALTFGTGPVQIDVSKFILSLDICTLLGASKKSSP